MISETSNIEFKLLVKEEFKSILTNEALDFVIALHEKFNNRRLELLQKREERQKRDKRER
ncbi:MAG: malate synthase A, partial [Ignavibacteria bacterium]|nr:malate synthase A [Ignavibacteria bacterium]